MSRQVDTATPRPESTVPIVSKRKKADEDTDQQSKKLVLTTDNVIDRYITVDRSSLGPRRGGPKPDPLVDKVAVLCIRKADPAKILFRRCAGADNGCEQLWKDSANHKTRYFAHASCCRFLPADLRQQVNASQGKQSLGKAVSVEIESTADTESISSRSISQQSTSSALFDSHSRNSKVSGSIADWTTSAGRLDHNKKINYAILKLICGRGLPPSIVDSQEWKDLMHVAAPKYQYSGSKTFIDNLIPREHAFIKDEQLKHLKSCNNLTISFDGQTTSSVQSVYTVHIITPERRIFLFEGNKCSKESHTGKFIFDLLDSVSVQFFQS